MKSDLELEIQESRNLGRRARKKKRKRITEKI